MVSEPPPSKPKKFGIICGFDAKDPSAKKEIDAE